MNNIQLVHEGEDYIKISFTNDAGQEVEAEVTESVAIKAIKVLGKALYKDSFIKKD